MRWDAKKKKYVRADVNDKKKIKTESGVWIPASYKSNRYAKWKERSKLAQMQVKKAPSMEIPFAVFPIPIQSTPTAKNAIKGCVCRAFNHATLDHFKKLPIKHALDKFLF